MGEGGRVVPPLAQLRLCTQDPGLAGGGQDTDLAAPPTGPPGDSTRTPASSLPVVRERWRGSPPPASDAPPPPPEGLVPCRLPLHRPPVSERSRVPPARVDLRSFPRSCLGQKPGRRTASLCGPRRADRPPNGATAGSCPTSSVSWVTPTVPGALGKHRVDWGQLPVTQGPSAGPEEGEEDREALTERGGMAKGSGTIWRLKPGQQGQTPREGLWGGSALGTWAWKCWKETAGRLGQCPPHVLGRGWLKPAQEGTGLWDQTPHRGPSPNPLWTSGWEGTRAKGCDRDSGPEEPPASPAHYWPWTIPQLQPELKSQPLSVCKESSCNNSR